MLALMRRCKESVIIGDNIKITVSKIFFEGAELNIKIKDAEEEHIISLNQSLQIADDIKIMLICAISTQATLGITAPKHIKIMREELIDRK